MVDRTIGRTNLVEAIEQAYGESSPPVCVLEPDEFERLCGKIVEAGDRLRS